MGNGDLVTSSGARDLREGSTVAVEATKKMPQNQCPGRKGDT